MDFINTVLSWVPDFDGQTLFSLIIGVTVSVLTFYWGYKKTIGAKEERIRSANIELAGSVLRRIAIEREPLSALQYDSIRRTKAYRAVIPERRLAHFAHVLDAVLTDIFDNGFIDKAAKAAIIELIDQSRVTEKTQGANESDAIVIDSGRLLPLLIAMSTLLGFGATVFTYVFSNREGAFMMPTVDSSGIKFITGLVFLAFGSTMFLLFKHLEAKRDRMAKRRERMMFEILDASYDPRNS